MGRMLIIGCGYVGGRLCEFLLRVGHAVWGMRRSGKGFPAGVRAPNPHRPAGATARRFRGNKRCSNRRLRETGWRPEFPSFREGYAPLLGMGDA